jgi:hypothetical protein
MGLRRGHPRDDERVERELVAVRDLVVAVRLRRLEEGEPAGDGVVDALLIDLDLGRERERQQQGQRGDRAHRSSMT